MLQCTISNLLLSSNFSSYCNRICLSMNVFPDSKLLGRHYFRSQLFCPHICPTQLPVTYFEHVNKGVVNSMYTFDELNSTPCYNMSLLEIQARYLSYQSWRALTWPESGEHGCMIELSAKAGIMVIIMIAVRFIILHQHCTY